ncbi:MAG TPA: OmpH family outer membrane protein [Pyrinomonadaceae bacterium]|jgi:Skp family chaperone for outer membrane proteins
MRRFNLIAAAFILAAIVSLPAYGQTTNRPAARPAATPAAAAPAGPVPDSKIAFVDTSAFGDDKAGIGRFVNALKSLEREFQPRQTELTNMQNRLRSLADEINKLNSGSSVVDPKTLQTKQDEGERLQIDLKRKKEDADAAFQKRYAEVVSPISEDIGKALDAFASQRGITMILDVSKLAPAILTVNPAMDVTRAFIAEYNSSHPATAATR